MSPFPYDALWHYSEKFTRDPDLRQDLVLLAWKESMKGGRFDDIRLLKNLMKLRAREIQVRSPLGVDISGKSKKDVWSHERVSIFKRVKDGSAFCLADTLSCVAYDPFGMCVVGEFEDALLEPEADVAERMVSGYKDTEGSRALHLPISEYRLLKNDVRAKALEYLA